MPNLSGKVCIVTGGSNGIGFETARLLAENQAHVILACRSQARGEKAAAFIKEATNNSQVEVMLLDLSSMQSIRNFASRFLQRNLPLNILINNAGILPLDTTRRTEDGLELTLGVNHLGHFLCTHLMLDALAKGAPSRVICVSSLTHRSALPDLEYLLHLLKDPKKLPVRGKKFLYSHSKLCNIMFAYELNRRFCHRGIYANAVCPGIVASNILNDANWSC